MPDQARLDLKNSILQLIVLNKDGAKHINVQLALALANLALQFLNWKDAVPELVNSLGGVPETVPALLEFLRVLPEELSSNRRIPITDDEFRSRSIELLGNNAEDVMRLLISYIQAPQFANHKGLIFQCFNSWLKEINPREIINSPFLDLVFQSLNDPETFDPVVDCICSMIRETRDIDDSIDMIEALYPRVISLRPLILQHKDELDTFEGLTLMFAEAGESWHMLIARAPKDFRSLVEALAECAAYDEDLDVVKYTFYFWHLLQQMIIMERYDQARNELGDIFLKLTEVLIGHLQYPISGTATDPFSGNREAEEKFKSFRHEMGDVLKDCCRVVGSSRALAIPYKQIYDVIEKQSKGEAVSWQSIEAPLFSIRCIGREVDPNENEILPHFMKLVDKLPEHDKIRYTATLVLGRYTEWSIKHPEYLEAQLNYITVGFSSKDSSVVNAAAQALRDICYDCGPLLVNYVDQLYPFYEKIGTSLSLSQYYNVTKGIASVVAAQSIGDVGKSLERFGEPICRRLVELSKLNPETSVYHTIADQIELLVIFVRTVDVEVPVGTQHPVAKFVFDVLPILNNILTQHGSSTAVSERYCKFLRSSILKCRANLLSILPSIMETLVTQFQAHHYGSYLWVTGAVLQEYTTDDLGDQVVNTVWEFTQQQIRSVLQYLSSHSNFREVPDLFDDFFLMMGDVAISYPFRLIASTDLFVPVYEVALLGIELYETDPVISVLRFLIDLFGYGSRYPPNSAYRVIPDDVRDLVLELIRERGGELFSKLLIGRIYSLPRDAQLDASTLMMNLLQLVDPAQGSTWIAATLDSLPANTVSPEEKNKLIEPISAALISGNLKRIKTLLNDFVNWYRRRNLSPRGSSLLGSSGNNDNSTRRSSQSFSASSAGGVSRFT